MTTPASGAISLLNINSEIGNGTNAISLDWLRNNTKDGIKDLNSSRNRAWYQRNVDGNCNNGNCATNCNCGFGQCVCAWPNNCGVEADCIGGNCYGNCAAYNDYWGAAVCNNCNCNNCTACTNSNCANCDARAWLQGNCNCACTYNCNPTGTVSYNCGNCACLCQCGGNCACGN